MFRGFVILDSSLHSPKNENIRLRLFVESDDEPFAYFEEDESQFHYHCNEKGCKILGGFIGGTCEKSCIVEWLVGETVVRRVRLLEHSDQETMEFSTVENGKEHVIVSKTWKIDLDSLINSQTTK